MRAANDGLPKVDLVALFDPPRPDVANAAWKARQINIRLARIILP
jgi:hypothetical protein